MEKKERKHVAQAFPPEYLYPGVREASGGEVKSIQKPYCQFRSRRVVRKPVTDVQTFKTPGFFLALITNSPLQHPFLFFKKKRCGRG